MCSIKKPSFYLLTFIYGLYKASHKQRGTMRLLGIDCKQSIKRQEKKSSECLREVWGKTGEACRGSTNQTALYAVQTGRRLYKENCKSQQLALPQEGTMSNVGVSKRCVCWLDLMQLPSKLCHYSMVCPWDYIRPGHSTMHQIYCPIYSPITCGEE